MSNSVPDQKGSCIFTGFMAICTIMVVISFLCIGGGCLMVGSVLTTSLEKEEASSFISENKALSEKVYRPGNATTKIALIDVEGVIGENNKHTEFILSSLKQATNDIMVKAILIRVDSPGGTVTASDTIYNAVLKAKESKPVLVYMDNVAASGGYYISCAANHITASPHTLTGSIGVIISGVNISGLMDKIGVSSMVYTSGAFKDMLSMTREPSEAEKAYIQSMVMESYDGFVKIVSEGRNISKENLEARNAIDGRVMSGKKALEMGLVDANGYIEDAITEAQLRADIKGSAQVVRYKQNYIVDIMDIFMGSEMKSSSMKVELMKNPLPELKPGVPYMLPEFYVSGASHE